MSATLAAELYQQYFGIPQPPIHVGARRFPIKEFFVEDLRSLLSLSSKGSKMAQDVYNDCERTMCRNAPSSAAMEKLYYLATQITASVGGNGSSVLIFVPGMSDIEAIIELIEKLNAPNASFVCLPIHSDIPFEEQMAAFEPAKKGEIKVIVATNAAESSLTLPDVDHVVCLGLCKQIVYNKASHRQMLMPTWISHASATQRAGRTGRVREGNVYRLYSRDNFEKHMNKFDEGEIVRTPLDSTILSLRDMLNEAVTPILLDCLEPPDISHIERSFQSLHASNFITDSNDEGAITSLGSLAVGLGIDLTLGAFVGLGIQFGVAAEAIQLAAILSFPKAPWAISSPMYHDTDTFNEIVSTTFASRCAFDGGLFSEPMSMSNLLHDYSKCKDRAKFCWENHLAASRMRHLSGTVDSLKHRVATCLNVSTDVLEVEEPPRSWPHAKINLLRILSVWLFRDTIITQIPPKKKKANAGGAISIKLDGPPIGREHLETILDPTSHPFEITNSRNVVQQGRFHFEQAGCFLESYGIRLVSFMLEKNIDLSFSCVGDDVSIFVSTDTWERPENAKLRERIIGTISPKIKEVCYLQNMGGGNQRGSRGRACGAWHPSSVDNAVAIEDVLPMKSVHVTVLSSGLSKADLKRFKNFLDLEISSSNFGSIKSILSCKMAVTNKRQQFTITSSGKCHTVSNADLCDLFADPAVTSYTTESTQQQSVIFSNEKSQGISGSRPLLEDSPEGARIMSVLGSERRRDNFIRFSDGYDESGEVKSIDVNLPKEFSIGGNRRWKQKNGGGMVFVPENSVPSAVIPIDNDLELFCCCANTLDLRGGACRVDGITMLPPGRLFVGLALLCFGVNPRTGIPMDLLEITDAEEEKKDSCDILMLPPILPFSSLATSFDVSVEEALCWIYENDKQSLAQLSKPRVEEALVFHQDCMDLGETLKCQPDKIKALCAIFDEVDGHTMVPWDGHDLNLDAASALSRTKTTCRQRTDRCINTNVDGPPETTATAKPMISDAIEQPCPSNPISSEISRPNNFNNFACVECKLLFRKWKNCQECCPGTQFNRETSATLATELSMCDTLESTNKDAPADITQLIKQRERENRASSTMWLCITCKEKFTTKEQCSRHIEMCTFGLVKHTKPELVRVTVNESKQRIERIVIIQRAGTSRKNTEADAARKFMCSSCGEVLQTKEQCANHIEKCGLAAVSGKTKKPKKVYLCRGCYAKIKGYNTFCTHMEKCVAYSIAIGTPKESEEKQS